MKTRLGPARREEAVDTFVRYTATPAAVSRLDCSTILDFKPMSDSARVRPSASSVWLAGVSSSICVVAGGAVAAFLLGLCASDFWICELLTHFRVHYALVLLAAGGLLLVCGGPKRGIAAVGAGLCISATLAPLYWSPAESPPIMKWRLVSANLFVGNQQPEKFVSFLEESRPDVVVCLEVTSKWAAVLDGLQTQYPHQVIEPRRGAFGVALLSRLPLSDVRVEQASPDNPVIVASIKISGDDVATVVAVHPVPPVAPDWTALRNQQLERIGQLASDCR